MSTPFDINVPTEPNSDVVINHEDGTQTVGTPEELKTAVDSGDVIGQPGIPHNPEQATDYVAPVPEEETPAEEVTEPEEPEEPAEETPEETPETDEGKPAGKSEK